MEAPWCSKLGMSCPFVIATGTGRQRARQHTDGEHLQALMMGQSIGHAHDIFHPCLGPSAAACHAMTLAVRSDTMVLATVTLPPITASVSLSRSSSCLPQYR